jgi:hypothetical protein
VKPRKALITVRRSAFIACTSAGALALSASAAQGPRITKVRARVYTSATKPAASPGPILSLRSDFRFPKAARSPQVKVELFMPAGMAPNFAPFSTCTEDKPLAHQRTCVLGGGYLAFSTSSQGAAYTLVNGAPQNGQPTVFIVLKNGIVAPASVGPAQAPYGFVVTFGIPRNVLSKYPFRYINFITGDLAPNRAGVKASFAQQTGPCPDGGWAFRARYTLASGKRLIATTTQPC